MNPAMGWISSAIPTAVGPNRDETRGRITAVDACKSFLLLLLRPIFVTETLRVGDHDVVVRGADIGWTPRRFFGFLVIPRVVLAEDWDRREGGRPSANPASTVTA